MVLQLPDRTRPGDFGFPAFATGNCPSDLGLIHSLRGRKAAELIKIDGGDGDDAERNRPAFYPNRKSACFQGVNSCLNEFFATRHVALVPFSLRLVPCSRSIR